MLAHAAAPGNEAVSGEDGGGDLEEIQRMVVQFLRQATFDAIDAEREVLLGPAEPHRQILLPDAGRVIQDDADLIHRLRPATTVLGGSW